jgi:hypothetical protein
MASFGHALQGKRWFISEWVQDDFPLPSVYPPAEQSKPGKPIPCKKQLPIAVISPRNKKPRQKNPAVGYTLMLASLSNKKIIFSAA